MSITQTRLDAYLAAELKILSAGAAVRLADRQLQQAELETIRKAIAQLQAQLASEGSALTGSSSLRHRTAVLYPCG